MKKTILILASVITVLTSCTDNQRAKRFGGTETVNLPVNCKFVSATWKQDDLWICYTNTVTGISYMKEKSNWGILEGTIEILPSQNVQTELEEDSFVYGRIIKHKSKQLVSYLDDDSLQK